LIRSKCASPRFQMSRVKARLDQLGIPTQSFLKVPWNKSVCPLHAIQRNQALDRITENADDLRGWNQFLNAMARWLGSKICGCDLAENLRSVGTGVMCLIPAQTSMKMNVEKASFFRPLGEDCPLLEYLV